MFTTKTKTEKNTDKNKIHGVYFKEHVKRALH